MTPWVMSQTSEEDLAIYKKVKVAVVNLPELNYGTYEDGEKIVLSCHLLARAIQEVFGIPTVDGFFGGYFNHSWNMLPSGNIIDAYPVGIVGGPLLVHHSMHKKFHGLYSEDARVSSRDRHSNFHSDQFLGAMKILDWALRLGAHYQNGNVHL